MHNMCILKSAKFAHFCYSFFFSLPLIFTGNYINFIANKYCLFQSEIQLRAHCAFQHDNLFYRCGDRIMLSAAY